MYILSVRENRRDNPETQMTWGKRQITKKTKYLYSQVKA